MEAVLWAWVRRDWMVGWVMIVGGFLGWIMELDVGGEVGISIV